MVVFQIQRRSTQELLCTGPPQVLDRQSLKTAVDADWGCEASNCQSSLNADSKQRITWNLKGVQSRDADSFQTDRKPLVPKNGYLSTKTQFEIVLPNVSIMTSAFLNLQSWLKATGKRFFWITGIWCGSQYAVHKHSK